MSDASEVQAAQAVPDQITKEPASPPAKVKDPKKVRPGKALAKKNREAREAQAALQVKGGEKEEQSTDFLSGIQMAASAVGAGFVLWHGWQAASPFLKDFVERQKQKTKPSRVSFEEEVEDHSPPPPTHTQPPTPKHEEAVFLMD